MFKDKVVLIAGGTRGIGIYFDEGKVAKDNFDEFYAR